LFEYNLDHPLTAAGLVNLCAHESIPGHYLNSAVADLLVRGGELPFESTVGTMCTASTTIQEGWAKQTLALFAGSRDAAPEYFADQFKDSDLEANLRVQLAAEDLEDAAKHDGALLHQRNKIPLGVLKVTLAGQYMLPDPLVEKISGAFSQHPIMGPMYGSGYHHGKRIVGEALREHSLANVVRVGLQLDGLVDTGTFSRKLLRLCA